MEDRNCPLCRENIPPSKEMITQLKSYRRHKYQLEEKGDIFSEHYMSVKFTVEKLEHEIGDWTESIDYSDDEYEVLPHEIFEAAFANDIQRILDWLGPHPVEKQRITARNPERMDVTMVHCALSQKHSYLLSILLQLGADVDAVTAHGWTPLALYGYKPEFYAQTRLLLEWGADISNCPARPKDAFIEIEQKEGNSKLANLLESEFGGRRCEVINLPKHPDLIGKTCVVEKYLPNKGRYKVVFETSKEVGLVGPQSLKRRDRTPDDCGYYISVENDRVYRQEFASKEECQAFVASLTEGKKSGDEDAATEAGAEQAAASLLAQLDIDSSEDSGGKMKGKQKG